MIKLHIYDVNETNHMISFKNNFFGKLYIDEDIVSNLDGNAETFLPKLYLIGLLIIYLDIAYYSKMAILEIEL